MDLLGADMGQICGEKDCRKNGDYTCDKLLQLYNIPPFLYSIPEYSLIFSNPYVSIGEILIMGGLIMFDQFTLR